MSSTGRSDKRRADDSYATPSWVVDALLSVIPTPPPGITICDPGCGEGAILEALREADPVRSPPGWNLVGLELNKDRAHQCRIKNLTVFEGDFLTSNMQGVDAVVANPPFSLAREFVDHSIKTVTRVGGENVGWKPGGFVAMLLRLAFLESMKRRDWWRRNPADIFVLPKRPSFTGDGKTDSCAYMWAQWGPGPRGRITVI